MSLVDERLRAYAHPDHPLVNKFWPAVDEERAAALAGELRQELAPEHPLYQRPARVLGAAPGGDDLLLLVLLDDGPRLVEVHLTWGPHPESPDLPRFSVHGGLDELIARAAEFYE